MPPEIPGYGRLVEIGRGGFAAVYRANDRRFKRTVAIKVLTRGLDAAGRSRFERECQAMGVVSQHPHTVPVHDSGFTTTAEPFLVMEDMTGGSMADRIARAPIHWTEAVDVAVKLCGALQAAHDAGVLHRDVKPENVLVSAYGEPKLADFGIAHLEGRTTTRSGQTAFTPSHAAPEIFEGVAASPASDVYSLASTVYALITGTPPFLRADDESYLALIARAGRDPVPDLRPRGVPDDVCRVIETAMEKNPGARFGSAADLGRALQDAQEKAGHAPTHMFTTPAPPGARERTTLRHPPRRHTHRAPETAAAKTGRRGRRTWVAVAVGLALLIATAAVVVLTRADGSGARRVEVAPTAPWTDTDIELDGGEELVITATGELVGDPAKPAQAVGPEGEARDDANDQSPGDPYLGFGHGALVGRIGEEGEVFLVGRELRLVDVPAGVLMLGVNDDPVEDNSGGYTASVRVIE